MEQIHGPIRSVQVSADTGLLRESAGDFAEYRSPEIPHANELRYLRVRGFDTSVIGRTALLYLAVYLLSFEHETALQVADLFRIAHDFDDQFCAVFYLCQQNVLLAGPAVRTANLVVRFIKNAFNKVFAKVSFFFSLLVCVDINKTKRLT